MRRRHARTLPEKREGLSAERAPGHRRDQRERFAPANPAHSGRFANQAREKAHALCLTGEFGAALAAVRLSEEAYGWGKWYQWQANSIRSRGWIWLRIGEQYPALRSYADEQAQAAFERAYALAGEYATQAGEMVDDRIKALLEIKRLAESCGDTFRWSRELEADLQVVAQRNPVAHSRYQAAAISSPSSREPLG